MAAPEKLYCMHRLSGDYSCSTTPFAGGDEYTRTDAFIEKALRWMISKGGVNDALSREMIEDFKNYMKGE